jgi:hypothetical protein
MPIGDKQRDSISSFTWLKPSLFSIFFGYGKMRSFNTIKIIIVWALLKSLLISTLWHLIILSHFGKQNPIHKEYTNNNHSFFQNPPL